MLNNQVFYHGIIRKSIVAFGHLFSDLYIDRREGDSVTGPVAQRLQVPIAYAPKEKWIVRIEQDPDLNNHTYISLPRMSFEMTGISYDTSRKLNRMNQITCYKDGVMTGTYAPIPYNIDLSMYIISKTQEDCLQIVEQILPFFNPDYNMAIKVIEETNTIIDVPVILNSVTMQDDYDGDFQTRRFVTYTLNFTMKVNLFGSVNETGTISQVNVNLSEPNRIISVSGNSQTGVITELFLDGF